MIQMGVGGELVDSTRIYPKHWSPLQRYIRYVLFVSLVRLI